VIGHNNVSTAGEDKCIRPPIKVAGICCFGKPYSTL